MVHEGGGSLGSVDGMVEERLDLRLGEPLLGMEPLERGALLLLEVGEQALGPLWVFTSVLGSVGSSAEAAPAFSAGQRSGNVQLEHEATLGCVLGSAWPT